MTESEGITIAEKEYELLPIKQQNLILFKNIKCIQKQIGCFQDKIDKLTLVQKIQYGAIGCLSIALGFMATKVF